MRADFEAKQRRDAVRRHVVEEQRVEYIKAPTEPCGDEHQPMPALEPEQQRSAGCAQAEEARVALRCSDRRAAASTTVVVTMSDPTFTMVRVMSRMRSTPRTMPMPSGG